MKGDMGRVEIPGTRCTPGGGECFSSGSRDPDHQNRDARLPRKVPKMLLVQAKSVCTHTSFAIKRRIFSFHPHTISH